jgi:hypothetical protein
MGWLKKLIKDPVGTFLDPLDLVDTGGLDGLTGVTGQEEAAREAARVQGEAGQEAIQFQREALEAFERRQHPFQELFFGAQQQGQALTPQAGSAAEMLQAALRQDIQAPSFAGLPEIRDPSAITQSPLFQALAEDTTRQIMANRALGGLGGSGGTRRAVTENLGLLGMQLGEQQFGQDLARRQQAFGETQQQFGNTIAAQQNRFNQLMGLLNTAQSSAAGVGQAGLATGQQVGGLLTDIAAAQAAGQIGAAGAKAAGRAGLMGLLGSGLGAAATGGLFG